MDLQQAFSRFRADLEAYITEEVARQVAAQMGGSAPVRTEVSQAPVMGNTSDVQASLDTLASLAKADAHQTNNSAVDQLLNDFGSVNPAMTPAPATMPSNGDYLKELANLSQRGPRATDHSSVDALIAMGGAAPAAPVAAATMPQPPQAAPVAPQQSSTVSGIQSFLDKIRQRKNLSSN